MWEKKLILLSAICTSFISAENYFGLNFNNNDIEVFSSFNLNSITQYTNGTSYNIDIEYLHTDGDNMTSIGLTGQNTFQDFENLDLAFGIKGVLASDFLAFPLTIKAVYQLPLIETIPPTYLSSSFAFAPTALSFRDAKKYLEFRMELNMEVISNIYLFTGYRKSKNKTMSGLDDECFSGDERGEYYTINDF